MAEYSTQEERTEHPTERRMGQLRKEGSIPLSSEIVHLATLVAGFLVLRIMASRILEHLQVVLRRSYALISHPEPLSVPEFYSGFLKLIVFIGPDIMIVCLVVATIAFFSTMLQTNFNMRERRIKFDFAWLNPIAGIKRMFSIAGLVNLGKALVKLAMILPLGYYSLKGFAPNFLMLMHMEIPQLLSVTADAMAAIFWKIIYILIPLAIFDYFWGRHRWLKGVKMTKDEVKDERKAVEGDEKTRRTIVAKGLQRVQQRLMKSVPQADVIVTNPTHYSVAIKYDRENMAAPIVVAKGQDYIALRIRQIAKEHGIPVLERKALARSLYASTDVGKEIPRELFRAAAEVLAYVYRIRGRNKARPAQGAR